jgi:hyperosmotically inducible protein
MRTSFAFLAAALLALAGCDSTSRSTSSATTKTSPATSPTTVNRPSYDSAASTSPAGDGDRKASNSSIPADSTAKPAPASTDKPGTAGPSSVEPDNTAVNKRDRDRSEKTPIDQNENQRDVNITAEIRKAVLATKDMSINARNVKIITADGKVTLRGPVNSEEEKKVIGDIARQLAGKDNVTDEIEVKTEK